MAFEPTEFGREPMVDDVAVALSLHVLAVIHWIGGSHS